MHDNWYQPIIDCFDDNRYRLISTLASVNCHLHNW